MLPLLCGGNRHGTRCGNSPATFSVEWCLRTVFPSVQENGQRMLSACCDRIHPLPSWPDKKEKGHNRMTEHRPCKMLLFLYIHVLGGNLELLKCIVERCELEMTRVPFFNFMTCACFNVGPVPGCWADRRSWAGAVWGTWFSAQGGAQTPAQSSERSTHSGSSPSSDFELLTKDMHPQISAWFSQNEGF